MSNVELLWREFFADPSQWWDKRKRKANPNAPDFKHKKTQKALWIDGPNNPGWVKFMLEEKCKADSQDDSGCLQLKWSMWEDYFTDPTMWWDNRMTKKNPRAPDFKHKVSKKMLRLDDSDNPEWVALRFANEQKMKTRDEINPEVYSPHILACSPSMEPKKMEIKKSNHDSFVVELDVNRPKAKGKIDWEMLSAEHAVFLLEQLVEPPSEGSLITILEKCRIERSLVYGRRAHTYICKKDLICHTKLGNYLVLMLVDCGGLHDAQQVFDGLNQKNEIAWSPLIHGYCECGDFEQALHLYEDMQDHHVQPSRQTLLHLLKACERLNNVEKGMVEEGWLYFELMKNDYGIMPTINHHNCMLDLLCRSGQLNAAMLMLEKMPSTPNLVSWKTMLSACRKWGNIEIAKEAYELAVRKNMNQPSVMALIVMDVLRKEETRSFEQELSLPLELLGPDYKTREILRKFHVYRDLMSIGEGAGFVRAASVSTGQWVNRKGVYYTSHPQLLVFFPEGLWSTA
ncbi:hypothetical protein GOP47_0023879 [Adiantum capillus-veneris]|uniref:Pentatricopeptide repeat-containing protein n=1 Tax=Adiantum capillus-veneris TaxID=13818 RepID=A0A9D4Z4V9_ADICA|nr:hypothetical protein GOP47_0023879 [Adiantum capillus-veneris]